MATLANVLTLQVASTADGYSVETLRLLVDEFAKVKGRIPLAMAASEARNFMGQRDGAPALGWIKTLYLDGTKLMATVEDVPKSLVPKFGSGDDPSRDSGGPSDPSGRVGLESSETSFDPRFRRRVDERRGGGEDVFQGDDHDDLMSVDRLTRTRMARTGESYGDAVREVLIDNPEVAKNYLCRRSG